MSRLLLKDHGGSTREEAEAEAEAEAELRVVRKGRSGW
jgi:hypothetical protein